MKILSSQVSFFIAGIFLSVLSIATASSVEKESKLPIPGFEMDITVAESKQNTGVNISPSVPTNNSKSEISNQNQQLNSNTVLGKDWKDPNIGVLPSVSTAQGQGLYPAPSDDYVNDFAVVINKPDIDAIRKMFKDLDLKTGIEAVAVTINSISDYNKGDTTLESFATNLFNTWGIGHKKENRGILILLAVKDRKCRIELGSGYGKSYDSAMKQVIEENMVPYFKTGDYGRGIFEGARGVIEKIAKYDKN